MFYNSLQLTEDKEKERKRPKKTYKSTFFASRPSTRLIAYLLQGRVCVHLPVHLDADTSRHLAMHRFHRAASHHYDKSYNPGLVPLSFVPPLIPRPNSQITRSFHCLHIGITRRISKVSVLSPYLPVLTCPLLPPPPLLHPPFFFFFLCYLLFSCYIRAYPLFSSSFIILLWLSPVSVFLSPLFFVFSPSYRRLLLFLFTVYFYFRFSSILFHPRLFLYFLSILFFSYLSLFFFLSFTFLLITFLLLNFSFFSYFPLFCPFSLPFPFPSLPYHLPFYFFIFRIILLIFSILSAPNSSLFSLLPLPPLPYHFSFHHFSVLFFHAY